MTKLLLLSLLLALSCGKKDSDAEPSDLERVQKHRDELCATFDPQTVERCDRITFVALMATACGRDYGLAGYEENGKWNRDTAPCYPQDSKSECSLDGYLSVLHYITKMRDREALQRMYSRLDSNGWICGEGPESVTSIKPLKSVIEHMTGASFVDEADATITGFRGHLLASYMWLRERVGMDILPGTYQALAADVPSSPFYAALAGDKSRAVDRLLDFPAPYSQFWGSAPDSVVYATSVAIIEGR